MPAIGAPTNAVGRAFTKVAGSGLNKLATEYTLGEEIGRGASGVVFKALNLQTGGVVAVKQVTLRGVGKDQLQLLQREIDLLKLLKNPYIVEYIESFNTKDTLYIVMEFVENGSLSQIIKKFGKLNEQLVGVYILQVLEGLNFLHEQGVIHRDIKGANILISTGGKVKLADFGVATKLEAAGLDTKANSVVGTPYWMAPEIIQMSGFTTASDIWSVGCTVIELISGAPPYFDLQPMSALFRIVHDPHPTLPDGISQALSEFLLLCFKKDTLQRPSAKRLKTHQWLTAPRPTGPPQPSSSSRIDQSAVDDASESFTPRNANELPEHILPKGDTMRQVEQLRADSLQPINLQGVSYAQDAAKGSTIHYSDERRRSLGGSRANTLVGLSFPPGAVVGSVDEPAQPHFPTPRGNSVRLEHPPLALAAGSFGGSGRLQTPRQGNAAAAAAAGAVAGAGAAAAVAAAAGPAAAAPPAAVEETPSISSGTSSLHYTNTTNNSLASSTFYSLNFPAPAPAANAVAAAGAAPSIMVLLQQQQQQQQAAAPGAEAVEGGPEAGRSDMRLEEMVAAAAALQQRLALGEGGTSYDRSGSSTFLAAFAEHPSCNTSYASLLPEQARVPPFHELLEWRLHSPWLSPISDNSSGLSSYEYVDPFAGIEGVSKKPDESDKALAMQRERLRTHIQHLQSASEMKAEQNALAACAKLLEIFSKKQTTEADRSATINGTAPSAACEVGGRIDEAALFMTEHGMLPLVHLLKVTTSSKVIHKLLQLLNAILHNGSSVVCETACLLGVIPAVLHFVEPHNPQPTRLEAARFAHMMCTRSELTLQMFVACFGLPALVQLLIAPAASHELVLFSIDAMKSVLDMRGRSPRNDLCRSFVELGVLELLVSAMHEINALHAAHAERAADIFLLFSCADTVVKARMATRKVLPELMQVIASPDDFEPGLVLKILRTIKHLCMGEALHMDELQRAKAIPHLVALLRRAESTPEMRSQCVNALYLLCKISRSRQEEAAVSGVLPPLQELIQGGSPLKQFALPIVCDIAKASRRARAELKQHKGVQFYLGLLSTEYWQEAALDALLVWLLDESSYVAKVMETPQGVQALQVVMETKNDSFVNMLDPLFKIVYNSVPVCRALGKVDPAVGVSPFVQALVRRLQHPNALVRRLLLTMLESLYKQHRSPKQLVERHMLVPVVKEIKDHDPGVLVQQIASQLYASFEAHAIL